MDRKAMANKSTYERTTTEEDPVCCMMLLSGGVVIVRFAYAIIMLSVPATTI